MNPLCVLFTLLCIQVNGLLDSGLQPSLEESIRLLTQEVQQLKQTVSNLKNQTQCHGPIAFSAALSTTIGNLGTHQRINFDHVLTNVGNAYNPTHGVFTAPTRGAYAFVVTVTNIPEHSTFITLRKNGANFGHVLAHGTSGNGFYETSTIAVNVYLDAGDEVWTQSEDAGAGVEEIDGYDWSMFSGHLIAAD